MSVPMNNARTTMQRTLPERRRSRKDTFNERLLKGLTLTRPYDIPLLEPCQATPSKLVAFSEAMGADRQDADSWVHFYEDDFKFERFWNKPEETLERLDGFAGLIGPDFSLYENMPVVQKIHNTYRNQLLSAWAQRCGVQVIANVRLSGPDSVPYSLAGIPAHSTIAFGLHGCLKKVENRQQAVQEIVLACDRLLPSNVLIYGSDAYRVAEGAHEQNIPSTFIHQTLGTDLMKGVHREQASKQIDRLQSQGDAAGLRVHNRDPLRAPIQTPARPAQLRPN